MSEMSQSSKTNLVIPARNLSSEGFNLDGFLSSQFSAAKVPNANSFVISLKTHATGREPGRSPYILGGRDLSDAVERLAELKFTKSQLVEIRDIALIAAGRFQLESLQIGDQSGHLSAQNYLQLALRAENLID